MQQGIHLARCDSTVMLFVSCVMHKCSAHMFFARSAATGLALHNGTGYKWQLCGRASVEITLLTNMLVQLSCKRATYSLSSGCPGLCCL
jgi:hypothetical protein